MIRHVVVIALILFVFAMPVAANPLILGTVMGDCGDGRILRKNGDLDVCRRYSLLYEGDRLEGNRIDRVEVKWQLNGEGNWTANNELLVAVNGKLPLDSLLPKVNEFLETVALQPGPASSHHSIIDFTKKKYPLPGFRASMLPGEPVSFSWSRLAGRTIIFNIAKGPEVFRITVPSTASVYISPVELNIVPSQDLTWYAAGVHGSFTVSLVDIVSGSQILQDLQLIDSETGNESYRKLKKAAYLQLVSDAFPDNIDLYWKSHDILQSVSKIIDRQAEKLLFQLDHRVEQQFDRQFSQACGSCHGRTQ